MICSPSILRQVPIFLFICPFFGQRRATTSGFSSRSRDSWFDSVVHVVVAQTVKPSDSWVTKVKSAFQRLVRVASPFASLDGIPSIKALDTITLVSSTVWKNHLVAFFMADLHLQQKSSLVQIIYGGRMETFQLSNILSRRV